MTDYPGTHYLRALPAKFRFSILSRSGCSHCSRCNSRCIFSFFGKSDIGSSL